MILDNSKLVAPFVPETEDGDTFVYTEMLDRTARKGNNGQRLLKTFYHRSREEFWDQWPTIQKLCDMSQVRAYTRLAPRSYKSVGRNFAKLVMDTVISENWSGMKSLYNRACGTTSPNQKLWLFDVDAITDMTNNMHDKMAEANLVKARIPSRKGEHIITIPFDPRPFVGTRDWKVYGEVSLHKDNPTNLYIPEGAA